MKAATILGHRSSVVVPAGTEKTIVDMLSMHGASEVIKHGDAWFDADSYLREVVMPPSERRGENPIYEPPFNHEAIWDGAESIMEEIYSQMPDDTPQMPSRAPLVVAVCSSAS